MRIFGLFKKAKRPPDRRILGQWLWLNDVARLEATQTIATVELFQKVVESGIIKKSLVRPLADEEADLVAGHVTQLLDGGSILAGYEPRISSPDLLNVANTSYTVLIEERPDLLPLITMTGILLAIRAWYDDQIENCGKIASHVLSLDPKAAEAFRVRGFAHFAAGRYEAARVDFLTARSLGPGLVGLEEPLKALDTLGLDVPERAEPFEPFGATRIRESLRTFSQILEIGISFADLRADQAEFRKWETRATELANSKAWANPQLTIGDLADFIACGVHAQKALLCYINWPDAKNGVRLPNQQKMREAFHWCLITAQGSAAMNPGQGLPDLSGWESELEMLFMRLQG